MGSAGAKTDGLNKIRTPRARKVLNVALLIVMILYVAWQCKSKIQRDLNRRLIAAVHAGDARTARLLLKRGANPDTRDVPDQPWSLWQQVQLVFHSDLPQDDKAQSVFRSAMSPYSSIPQENVPLVQAFVEAGAKDSKDALSEAFYGDKPNMVRMLLDHGVRLHTSELNDSMLFASSVRGGDLELVRTLLTLGVNPLVRDNTGRLPIHSLSDYRRDDIKVAELLVKLGNDVNAVDDQGKTPLMGNIYRGGNAKVVEFLLTYGAKVNVRSKNGESPLECAILANNIDAVKLLLKHNADINGKATQKRTPLHIAAYHGSLPIVELLLAQGADIEALDQRGDTPLTFCLWGEDNTEIVRALLKRGAHVKHKNIHGDTALSRAKKPATIELLETASVKRGYAPLRIPVKSTQAH